VRDPIDELLATAETEGIAGANPPTDRRIRAVHRESTKKRAGNPSRFRPQIRHR
jgi:hypothetical protein